MGICQVNTALALSLAKYVEGQAEEGLLFKEFGSRETVSLV